MTEISNFIPGVTRFLWGACNLEFTFSTELAILENEYESKGSSRLMKRIDFENGTVTGNILKAALPMLVAQILNLLYNIVDRIYIARIPGCGTAALGAVGLCFPLIVILSAFANLFGSGGAPLFSIYRGKKETQQANRIMNTSFTMVCVSAILLMTIGLVFARPLLVLFGASGDALVYAYPYMMLYLIGTLPSMIAVGMNPFINAQGYSLVGMCSVAIGASANLLLDPLFIFVFGLGVQGAAVATVLPAAFGLLRPAFPDKKGGAEGSLSAESRIVPMYRLCKKYRQPRHLRLCHAADQQPCYDLLQQRSFRHRRRYLHFRHDHRFQRATARGNADLRHHGGNLSYPEL